MTGASLTIYQQEAAAYAYLVLHHLPHDGQLSDSKIEGSPLGEWMTSESSEVPDTVMNVLSSCGIAVLGPESIDGAEVAYLTGFLLPYLKSSDIVFLPNQVLPVDC